MNLESSCPMCGGDAEIDCHDVPDGNYSVTCCECAFAMPNYFPTKEQAENEWLGSDL